MLNRWIAPNNPILAQQLRAYRADAALVAAGEWGGADWAGGEYRSSVDLCSAFFSSAYQFVTLRNR